MSFTPSELPYAKAALEPYISARTLEFHHGKHYKTYVDNLNKLVSGSQLADMTLEEIIKHCAGKQELSAIFNNAAQAWNHEFFWQSMRPNGGGEPTPKLKQKIERDFKSLAKFKEEFKAAALSQFGSGWAWLVEDESGILKVIKTSNADTPLAHGLKAIITLDVWEHAYYLDYQNRRGDFADAFLEHLVNW
ncbi:MAG: superoxide dismutase [Alphaproteobacteria bacterium]|nr:superoxide dismutase [Alphaproteobacteria bacterium]MBR1649481.1 superoxide dismutase [Alphaproteobacteria bacterium]